MKPIVVAPTRREADALRWGALVCTNDVDIAQALAGGEPGEALLIAGVCGGLDPSLPSGSIILARGVSTPAAPEITSDAGVFAAVRNVLRARRISFVSSTLLTVDRPVASRVEKTALWNTFGAAGVDMETYELAAAAARRNIPWLALRVVLDPSGGALPASLRDWRPASSESDILRRVGRRPWEWPATARLALQMRTACRVLRRTVDIVLPEIASMQTAHDDGAPDRGVMITLDAALR